MLTCLSHMGRTALINKVEGFGKVVRAIRLGAVPHLKTKIPCTPSKKTLGSELHENVGTLSNLHVWVS